MKIAVLISGYLRSLENNIQSIKKKIVKDYDVDFYIHITNNENEEDKYYNEKVSLDLIRKELNPKLMIVEDNKKFKKHNNLYNQYYKLYKLKEEVKKTKICYDIILKTRPDVYYHHAIDFEDLKDDLIYLPIDSKCDKNKINASLGGTSDIAKSAGTLGGTSDIAKSAGTRGGTSDKKEQELCDILAYGKCEIMYKYLDIYRYLETIIGQNNSPETLLYKYLNSFRIAYKKIDINYSVILSLCKTIAISGDSGSGKTTLSEYIKKNIKNSFILECDRYHKWERGNKNWENITHLNPEANYLAKMEKDVFDLKLGKNIYQIDYDHSTGKFTDKKLIKSDKNIVVCGLHSIYISSQSRSAGTSDISSQKEVPALEEVSRDIAPLKRSDKNNYNLKIFMDTDEELKIKWKIERDTDKRGYSKEKILKQIETRREDYEKYILPQREKSDIIVNYKLEKGKIILNLKVKNIWYKFTNGNYNQIIYDYIKTIY